MKQSHKSVAAAASSAEPIRRRGMCGYSSGVACVQVAGFAPGMPSATFFPSISIVAPLSFAAVNLVCIDRRVSGTMRGAIGRYSPCLDETKGDGVCTDAERTPLFCNGLCQADDGSFSSGVVGLADIAMEAGCRRDIDD
jgi:hypothetical protein